MSVEEILCSNYNAPLLQTQQGNNYNNTDNNIRGIIIPFTTESKDNDFGNHNNNKNMGYLPNCGVILIIIIKKYLRIKARGKLIQY